MKLHLTDEYGVQVFASRFRIAGGTHIDGAIGHGLDNCSLFLGEIMQI
jgi:hypothetical protein